MFKHEKITCLFVIVLLLLLTVSAVSAFEDNMTDDLATENIAVSDDLGKQSVVESDDNEIILEKGNNAKGTFVDASDAYDEVNKFRSEYGVWMLTSDTTAEYYNTNEYNQIKPLERDIVLEEVAKIRAKEIVELFDHQRPDGTSCFEIYPDYGSGENILYGYLSAKDAVEVWREDFAYFEDQGHRRNMLSPVFDSIGIAGYKIGDRTYWVQSFGIKDFSQDYVNITPADRLKGTFEDLKNLLDNGANIKLNKDYNFNNDSGLTDGISIKRPLTIDGSGHSIDARHLAQIFNITADNVVLKDITFMNANMESCAISVSARNVSFVNCSFIGNNGCNGGALSLSDADVLIEDCSFSNNFAAKGGAIYTQNSAVSFLRSVFIGNGAVLNGGALSSNNSTLCFDECSFNDSSVFFKGGALYMNDCHALLSNCEFTANSAIIHGAGIFANKTQNSILNCSFKRNCIPDIDYNDAEGSAICEYNCAGEVKSCLFDSNAVARLGIVYLSECDIDVMDCSFTNNKADSGILYLDANRYTITNCSFVKNNAYIGGGILSAFGSANVRNCSFISNTVLHNGGAISLYASDLLVEDSIFVNNRAEDLGNSISADEDSDIYIEGCSFLNSRGKDYSYEILSWGEKITMVESVSVRNYDPVAVMPFTGTSIIRNSKNIKGSIANSPIIASTNAKVTYNGGSYYTIILVNADGKFAAGAKIAITVNGKKFKTLTANQRGIAKFKVTQAPGTYKISMKSSQSQITRTLTVKHLITLKSVNVKKSAKKLVLQASLGKTGGKYIKNAKITFKFNGKKYTAKTNSKGVAKVTVKSSVLKKLKIGKKVSYQATYLKDTVKKTSKVKR